MDNRLKRKSDFDLVFKKGKKCYGKKLMVVYKNSDALKVGYSVSKKNGGAVIRNRIKRILRAIVREYKDLFIGKYYIVLVPKPAENYSYHELKAEFFALLNKERLLSEINE